MRKIYFIILLLPTLYLGNAYAIDSHLAFRGGGGFRGGDYGDFRGNYNYRDADARLLEDNALNNADAGYWGDSDPDPNYSFPNQQQQNMEFNQTLPW